MAKRPGFAITVTAVDQASAQFDKINKSIARMSAPAEQFNRQVSKFGDVSGITRMTDGVRGMTSGFLDSFRAVDRLAGSLGLVTGVTSLAGIAAFTDRWRSTTAALNSTSKMLGVGVSTLSKLQGAARLAGIGAEDMNAGLKGLGETLRDATFGRNSDAIQMFRQLKVEFEDSPGKVRDMVDVLPELADKIAAIKDPFTQARIATTLFGGAGEAMLPFLRKGSAGIKKLTEEVGLLGNMDQAAADAATRLTTSIEKVKIAGEGLANEVLAPLAPHLERIAEDMAAWTKENKDWLASDITKNIKEYGSAINNVVKEIGGWKEVAGDLLLYWSTRFMPGMIGGAVKLYLIMKWVKGVFEIGPKPGESLDAYQKRKQDSFGDWMEKNLGIRPGILERLFTPSGETETPSFQSDDATKQARAEQARQYFTAQGYTPEQVAGILANIRGESGFEPGAFNPAGGGEGAQGIGQWRGSRIEDFRKMFGRNPRGAPYEDQLKFMAWELKNKEAAAGRYLRLATTPDDAANAMTYEYSRPEKDKVDEIAKQRRAYARGYASTGGGTMPVPPIPPPVPPAAAHQGGAAAPGTTGRVQVDVNLRGAPAGTTATATASGAATAPPPRVEQAMPFGGP